MYSNVCLLQACTRHLGEQRRELRIRSCSDSLSQELKDMNINHQRQPKYKKENSKCHPSRDHESQEFRGGKDTKLETGGWRGGKRLEQQPREGFEKERLVNKVKLYKEGGELGLLDLASSKPSRSQRMEDENQTANGERQRHGREGSQRREGEQNSHTNDKRRPLWRRFQRSSSSWCKAVP